MLILASAVFCLYFFSITLLYTGWRGVVGAKNVGTLPEKFISVIIPVRNESANIGNLLEDIANQTYARFEVIVVDDHSEDDTSTIVKSFSRGYILFTTNMGRGKKTALQTGIEQARGEIIVTTDGDCRVPATWLYNINRCFLVRSSMVAGAVIIDDENSFLAQMQQLEFASLIGTGAATISLGFPTMCNGANLAYKKSAFSEVNGYNGNLHIASGDDEFLMRKISDAKLGSIQFNLEDPVRTAAQKNIYSFFLQRIRWAGKWRSNSSIFTRTVAVFVVCLQALVIYSWIQVLGGNSRYLILLVVKLFLEAWLLYHFSIGLKIKWRWAIFFTWQLIYPLYVPIIGIFSLFSGYQWKGRYYA
jgi:poly-beta-1,6-N-acetyl-D-glucosamine synthase